MAISVGCTCTGIYAGNVNTLAPGIYQFTGKKTDVTEACMHAVIQWMEHPDRGIYTCNGPNGRKYTLSLTIEEEQ